MTGTLPANERELASQARLKMDAPGFETASRNEVTRV